MVEFADKDFDWSAVQVVIDADSEVGKVLQSFSDEEKEFFQSVMNAAFKAGILSILLVRKKKE